MTTTVVRGALLPNVLETLAAMGDIATCQLDEATTILYKTGVPFCLVMESDIYLRSKEGHGSIVFQDNKYNKILISPEERDDFLLAATKAYWIASDKWCASR